MKNTVGGDGTFNFTGNTGVTQLITSGGTNSQTVNNLVPGSGYNISETVPTGWDLNSFTCDNGTIAAITVAAGQTTTCTATNTKRGHLIVDKVTNPSGDTQSFAFTTTGTGYSGFNLTDAAAPNDQTVAPGSYSVAETAVTGWDLTSSPCVSSNGDTETIGSISLQAGETVTCTFNNRKRAHIIVDKVTTPSGDTTSFSFTAGGSGYSNFNLTDAAAPNDQSLAPGSYSVSEGAVTGWDLTSSPCVSSNGDTETIDSISLQAGETVTCTFNNRKRGHIIIDKVTNPSGDTQSFTFTPNYNGGTTFQLADATTPNDSGAIVPGNYSVSEGAVTGWDKTSAVCSDGSAVSAISLQAGETVTCTFTNTKRGLAQVIKTFNGGALGVNSFIFQLRSGASAGSAGTILESGTANSGNSGTINFATTLVPGTTYQMCEQMQPGWLTTLGPPLYSVFNPSGDNSVVCTDFTVAPGATKTFTINNQPPPGGMGLTIGFWKNWSACAKSNGGQKPTLDRTLQLGDLTLGTLVLHDSNSNPDVASDCQP